MSSYYPSEDQKLNIARGLVKGTSAINKFGYNDAVGTSYETIWNVGGTVTYLTNANTVVLTSTDSDDTAAGTGARVVEVQGLDENYNQATVTVPMNGTGNASNTDINFIRVFRMRVSKAGSQNTNDGDITATIGGTTVSKIDEEEGQTLQANYTIPAGYKGYILDVTFNAGKENKAAKCKLITRPFDNGLNVKQLVEVYRNTVKMEFPVPLEVDAKTDIEIQALNENAGTTTIAGTFNLILIKEGLA